jgi:hypothetical protein
MQGLLSPFNVIPSELPEKFYVETQGPKITLPLAGTWFITHPWSANGPRTFDTVVATLLQKYPPNMQRIMVYRSTYIWSSESIEILVRNMRGEILPATAQDPEELVPTEDKALVHCYAQAEVDISAVLPEAKMIECVICSQIETTRQSCIHRAALSPKLPVRRRIDKFQPY